MTTTDAAKLREAAERVQNVVASWKQEDIDKLNHEPCRVMLEMWKSDISSLARHVLATVPEDATPPRPLQPGDKVLVEGIVINLMDRGDIRVLFADEYCLVPLSAIRPFPQEESSQ